MNQKVQFSRQQRLYFWAVISTGLAVSVLSAAWLYLNPVPSEWLILAALTLLTGSFTIRIAKPSVRISVSDAFVFAAVLLFGTAAATVIVAIDSLLATLYARRENRSALRSLYNLAVASISIFIASTVFYWMVPAMPSPEELILTSLLAPLFVLAAAYFLINSWLVATALGFEHGTNVAALWWNNFPWFSLNYFGGVSAAALLVSYTRTIDVGAISVIVPLLVISYLTYRTSLGRLEDAQQHVNQLNTLYMSTVETLAMAVDAKDQITHGHIRRVQVYALELAKRVGVREENQLRAVEASALLHDLGKLAIPEHILNKPGKLTPAEFENMKRHAAIGADLLSSINFPYPVAPIVRHHHENWDGTGYPAGISGTDIPIGARILSVVDCFDALTSDRPYRPRLSAEEAFTILRERRGSMYDPLVVDTFIAAYPQIAPLAIRAGSEAKTLLTTAPTETQDSAEALALKQIRASTSEAAVLNECLSNIANAASAIEAINIAGQALRQLTPLTTCAFFRYAPETDELDCEFASGDPQRLLTGLRIRLGERVSGWSAANRRSSLNSDASLDLLQIASVFTPALRSTICVPLLHGDRVLGALTGYSPQVEAFSEAHRYTLERVGSFLTERLASEGSHRLTVVSFPAKHSL